MKRYCKVEVARQNGFHQSRGWIWFYQWKQKSDIDFTIGEGIAFYSDGHIWLNANG